MKIDGCDELATVGGGINPPSFTSLLAFIWLYVEQKDSALIARHSFGTFWFVLPTLPMFLVLPWLVNEGMTFWPDLGLCIAGTVVFYFVTMKQLAMAGVQL